MIERNRRNLYLSEDLINEIVSRLPVKSLLRFKCVCKSWCNLIKTQEFINLHLKRSNEAYSGEIINLFCSNGRLKLNFHHLYNNHAIELYTPSFLDYYNSPWNELAPPILVGSVNGLLCFALPFDRYVMYNPSTREFKELPKVKRTNCYGFRDYSLVVYDHANDDYKVFELFRYYENHGRDNIIGVECLMFSMKGNSWKTIDTNVPYYKSNFVVVNNFLRWIDREGMVTRSFNLFSEKYDNNIILTPVSTSLLKDTGRSTIRDDLTSDGTQEFLMCVLREAYRWMVVPCLCLDGEAIAKTKCGGSNPMLGWSDPKVQIPYASNKCGSLVAAKPWVESLVSLEYC